jgi:Cna protein B-type domain.
MEEAMKTTSRLLTVCIIANCLFALLPLHTATSAVLAQTNVGRISGTVTDTSGGTIQGATIKVTNEATGVSRMVTTDDSGFYVVTNLLPGDYTVTTEQQGFKKAVQTGYVLVADGRLTVNVSLEPGTVSDSVTVTAANTETINTTSGEVARVIDGAQVRELALNGRNYLQLTTLIPGAPLLNDDQLGLMTSLSTSQPINGNRGNANNLTVDGGSNLDSGSNASQINNVGIDFIQEVKIQTSNFSAEYGRNSGASINVITKSGGNQFHGSAFEFLRNDQLDANNYFSNARGRFTTDTTAKAPDVIVPSGDARAGKKVVDRPTLRYNNFGFSFGGPILKDKLFFFGGIEWKFIRQFSVPTNRTIPTTAELLGDFSLRLAGPDGRPGTADDGKLIDPVTKQQFPGNKIPTNRITPDGRALANVFSAMAEAAVAFTDSPIANNALYQRPNPFDYRQDILRLDYRINSKQSIYGRYIHDNYDLIDPFGTFITSQLPTVPSNRLRPGFSYQIAHTWVISPTIVNEAKVSAAWNGQRIPPVGDAWKRETYGFTYPQLFVGGGRFENSIPDVNVTGFATFAGAARSLISPTTDISFGDNITWTRGKHTLKTGALVVRNRKDQNGRTTYAGNLTFNNSGNSNSTGNALGDMLLGNFRTYSEAENDPLGFFRFTQVEAYVSDTWKVHPRLSLELGARYQFEVPIYTQANNVVNFDPFLYDPAKAVTILANGLIDTTKGGNRFNGLIRAGSGVPESELARVPNGSRADVLAVPAGAPRGLYQTAHVIAPRLGFAWSPFSDDKTSIRGGFGMFFDRPEGNIIFSSLNIPPFSNSAQFENGNLSNPAGGRASALAPFDTINTIDPNLKVPYTMSFSLGVQHELPYGILGEVDYVGNLGRHLIRQPDINQPSFAAQAANAALPAAQRRSINALRPYKGFSQIRERLSDSTSNYHALQLYAAKRTGNLTLTAGYTWSKVLTDSSSNTDNPEEFLNRHFSYGPATFDRRHIFVATYTYRVPFFRSLQGIGRAALTGWELSGITHLQSGSYLTPTATTSIGSRRADYLGGEVSLPSDAQGPGSWFNAATFAPPPDNRLGNAGVGIIVGPGRRLWDLSARKLFDITEGTKLQFQADFFNAFNQTNFNDPGVAFGSLTSPNTSFGKISGAAPGRNIQLGLKLVF